MNDTTAPVLVERDDAVATVTINRPDRRNALDEQTKCALRDALKEVADDRTVRAVVLTGSGSAFCVGQDLAEHATALAADASTAFGTVDQHYNPIVATLASMPKPVIAAVNGTCVGAGLGFALACDLRVFAEGASLGTAFSAIGLTCDSGLSLTLSRAVGGSKARELVLLARPFSAEDAVGWGVSGDVVPAGEVLASAQRIATKLASGPTAAYAASKKAIADASTMTLPEALGAEGLAQQALGLTADHQGAVSAFLAKEKPVFTGR